MAEITVNSMCANSAEQILHKAENYPTASSLLTSEGAVVVFLVVVVVVVVEDACVFSVVV